MPGSIRWWLAAALFTAAPAYAQSPPKSLLAVFAHADDETSVAPLLARLAREGVQVHLIIVTDGAQGAANTSIPRGAELARVRADEARCATDALGIQPPILLGLPDGVLGDYVSDPALLYRLTPLLHAEIQRLRPDAVITWGPDGGTGHPDHRLVGSIVTQLVRAKAPGMPQRLFYASISAAAFRAINPTRGEPPFVLPAAEHLSLRAAFEDRDFEAARRSMLCHRTQFSAEVVERVMSASRAAWNGAVLLAPWSASLAGPDIFR